MGTIVRCCLVIIGVTLWLMFACSGVSGSLSSRSKGPSFFNLFLEQENDLGDTPYSECDDLSRSLGKVTKVEVVGCDSDPCQLKAGSTATININFIPAFNVTAFNAVVHGMIGPVPVPFHIPHPDGCTQSGVTCPLVAGTEYHYTSSIPVLKNYPKISVKVKWQLMTNDEKEILCVLIPAKIVP